jgi:hypothetical protein
VDAIRHITLLLLLSVQCIWLRRLLCFLPCLPNLLLLLLLM